MKLLLLAIILPLVALLPSMEKRININGPLVFVSANVPPTSSRGGRFNRKRNKKQRSSDASDGLTLGDLEALQQQSTNNGGGTFIPTEAILGQQRGKPTQQIDQAEEESSEQSSHQLRRSLRRINLDLSGRVMCHVLSPNIQNDDNGNDRPVVQMNSIPLFEVTSSRLNCNNEALRRIQRHIPHIYMGADYDLDEIWYGATRWIAKCSWSLTKQSIIDNSRTARQLVESIFPNTAAKISAWMFDLEREQSVFEHSDSTTRASLVQQSLPSTIQKLSLEYDSAKYSNNRIDNPKTLVQAPTISVNVLTPILHPRIELRMKRTWIVQEGGDKHDNYYGGTNFGSISPVERRLESIRDGYRAMIPRSQFHTDTTFTSTMGRMQTFGRRLSNWLEEDGWMPKRVTTDLMGNFVSVNELGFSSESNSKTNSGKHFHPFLPSRDNMGIRLRISKRIDWTSLGIFPWSSNNPNHNQNSSNVPAPTRVRFDLCGLHNSGNTMSQIGCEFDPMYLGDTFKVVIGQDGVGAD